MANKTIEKNTRRPSLAWKPMPTWDIALLYPNQGHWAEDDYLSLDGDRLVELSDGVLEILPVPTTSHQLLIMYLCGALNDFALAGKLGLALVSGIRVRLGPENFRAPDVVFMLAKHVRCAKEEFWEGADLVMEIVCGSSKDRRRDLVIKRVAYARAGMAEYWIVDPKRTMITVLTLKDGKYEVHGEFKLGTTATSRLLPGFGVDVTKAFEKPTP